MWVPGIKHKLIGSASPLSHLVDPVLLIPVSFSIICYHEIYWYTIEICVLCFGFLIINDSTLYIF